MSIDFQKIFQISILYRKGVTLMANIDKIKAIAKSKGTKMRYLCSKIGVVDSFFADAKNGKTTISDERLKTIADLLGTTPEYLRDETDDPGIKKAADPEDDGLSELDCAIVDAFRKLPEEEQKRALAYLDFLKKQQ